ncbi:uncharacterized protein [Asterias amurensis]|uniref:uncharacterized protein n=1 Tax=Asterias amurensis TaxID=7602 RepID=UPI003AB1708E
MLYSSLKYWIITKVTSNKMASNITTQSVLAEISQDHLECPICSGRFKQPKLLECSHSFCLECLQKLRQNSPSTTRLSCPVCRKETLLKENGIDGLKTDFKTISLIEAIETKETRLRQQQGKQVPSQEFVSKCSKHTGKDLILYCEICKKLICSTCIAKDHRMHPVIELSEASDKSKQHATELLAEVRQSITSYNIAIQKIDMSRKTLDSMFAATKEKISKKADEEIAKEAARIREEKQKLIQEAEQIYKDRVKTMQTARATNSKEKNKAEHKQDEVNQLMDQRIKIVHHIEQLLQDLKEYRETKSTKLPDGLTYIDFKEGKKSLGRLVLNDDQRVESATSAQATKPTFQSMKHFKQDKWTLKRKIHEYKNIKQKMVKINHARDVAAYSNSDIVVVDWNYTSLIKIPAESNPQSSVVSQELPIQGLTRQSRVTVNTNDELIVLDNETVKIFNRNYQLLHQFNPGSKPSCIAVDDNNLIAVGYRTKAEISLHKPDGSLSRRLSAPGIGGNLTTYKQRLVYTNNRDMRLLVSITYNGEMVFSVDINQSGWPRGVCCDKDGSIYVAVRRGQYSSSSEIHHYSPDGKYIGCIIKDCAALNCITYTSTGDLVAATYNSVQIYQHE